MKNLFLTLFFALLSLGCFAQYTISGRVIGQADTRPVPNASVFLSNATIGNTTGADGSFRLTNVKPGKYTLVISIVGFDVFNQVITVTDKDIDLQTITIFPRTIGLAEVKIKGTKGADPDRAKYITWFTADFLGNSDLAKECKLLNPEMLDFNYDNANNILNASSVDFLIVRNEALGYNVKYLLKTFTTAFGDNGGRVFNYSGSILFEPMKGSAGDEKGWQQRRKAIYEGSQLHFFRSAIAGTWEQDGFRVLRLPANKQRPPENVIQEKLKVFGAVKNNREFRDSLNYWTKKESLPRFADKVNITPLKKEDIVSGPDKQGLYTLSAGGDALFITYNKYHRYNKGGVSKLSDADNKDNTLLVFNGPNATFDKNGIVLNPEDLAFEGVWSNARIPMMLPSDYEPGQDNSIAADTVLIKSITSKVDAYNDSHISESTYLHFDKPYYVAGDTMYFKAYVTMGQEHAPTTISAVLYVDLIKPDNKIDQSIKLYLANGVAWGDLALPRTLAAGSYRVRAYTQWMRNDGGSAFFDKSIPIGTTTRTEVPENAAIKAAPADGNPDISFFPEGGSLIAGVKSKIAFKAVGPNGLGIELTGVVVDNDNKEVAAFSSAHLGMGYFYLTPAEKATYTARISYANGLRDVIELPKCTANGIAMSVTDQGREYAMKISSGKQWYQQHKNNNYTLVVYAGGLPQSITFRLDDNEKSLSLPKKDMHSGITTATLFSATGEPLCERLVFVQNNDELKLNISTDKTAYATKTKTGLKLNVAKATGEPVLGHFSVAVIDERKVHVDESSESTIMNNLLLTSALKGYIEQPNYYFTNVSEKTAADLDLVMLTHGYRFFDWQKIFGNNAPSAWLPERGLVLAGQLNFGGKPLANGKIKLFSRVAGGLILDTLSDQNGRFVFDNLSYDDTTKFVLQARTELGQKDVEVKPDTAKALPAVSLRNSPPIDPGNYLTAYEQHSKAFLAEQEKYIPKKGENMLKEVKVTEKKANPFENSQNLNGKGRADVVITKDWLETSGYNNLYDAIRAKVSGLIFTPNHRIRSNRTVFAGLDTASKPDYMRIIVDGTIYFDEQLTGGINANPLEYLETADTESIEILTGPQSSAAYGSQASGGAIIVTTKRARRVNNYYREAPGVLVFRANGFYKARKFYSPKYDHPTDNNRTDLRTTIYWNPEVVTDKDGNALIDYYNAGGAGSYRIVVEGMDAEGNLGRQVYRYKVE